MTYSRNDRNLKKIYEYDSLFELNPNGIMVIDSSGEIQFGNPAIETLSGYTLDELVGHKLFAFVDEEQKANVVKCLESVLNGSSKETTSRFIHKSGEQINCLVYFIPVDRTNIEKGLYLIFSDLRDYDFLTSKFLQSEMNFKIIAENVQDVIILMNEDREYLYVSPSTKEMFGFDNKTVEEMLGKDPFFYNYPEDSQLLKQSYINSKNTGKAYHITLKLLHREKGWVWSELKAIPVYDDDYNFRHMLLVARDISLQKERQEMLEYYAYHDSLTGLPNRRYFEKSLTESMEKLNLTGEVFSLILFDIDDFKKINDTWGHGVGDQVIREVANRTEKVIGKQGISARLGGDEFVVVLGGCKSEGAIKKIILDLQKALSKEIVTEKNIITITNSIGAAICTKKYKSETYYFKSADVALYEVKNHGKNKYHIIYS